MRYDTIKFKVYGQLLRQYNSLIIVENTVNFLKFQFIFSEDWEGKIKTAVFDFNGTPYRQLLDSSDICYVPHEVIHLPGFKVTVFAAEEDQVIRTTEKYMCVAPSGSLESQESVPPTPDIYQQILEMVRECRLTAGDGIAIVDGVISVASVYTDATSVEDFPEVGKAGKLYIDTGTSTIYRWDEQLEDYVIVANDWHNIEIIDSDARYS